MIKEILEIVLTMKKEIIRIILQLFIDILAVYLTLRWYGWKVLIIIFLFMWANNMMVSHNRNQKKSRPLNVEDIIKAVK